MSWKDEGKERVAQKKESKTFKLAEGPICVRVCPKAEGSDSPPYIEVMMHREVGPNKRSVRCGKEVGSKDGECWICDTLIPKLRKSNKASSRELAKKLEPKEQFICQVAWLDQRSEKMRGPK